MDQEYINGLKTYFIGAVVDKEKKRLKAQMNLIQDQHALKHGCRAFLLDGKVVWNGDVGAARIKGKKPLDPEHQDEARKLVNKINKITADTQRLTNFFGVIQQRCHDLQDYRDIFPDMVVERMAPHEITGIPRTREPGYAFTSPAKKKLYQDGMDIVYHYLVNQLVF